MVTNPAAGRCSSAGAWVAAQAAQFPMPEMRASQCLDSAAEPGLFAAEAEVALSAAVPGWRTEPKASCCYPAQTQN